MIGFDAQRIVAATNGEIAARGGEGHPERAVVDSREVRAGDLFFGLRGEHLDGGEFAGLALEAGAWGVVVDPSRAAELAAGARSGWVLAAPDPLAAMQRLARAWRRELGCPVVGITGSTGKTTVKDITQWLLPMRVHASPENHNTEIGLPLAILAAPLDSEVLVLEMAMRGPGQIAELCEIAEPGIGAITNVGPVHLELLGSLEAIAEAKAELLRGLAPGGVAVVPADAEALEPHLPESLRTITFGPSGEVSALAGDRDGRGMRARIGTPRGEAVFELPFAEAHNLRNVLAAVAIGIALDVPVGRMAERAARITLSPLRGELIDLGRDITLVNDCYNANPIAMRAALDHLVEMPAGGRRVAVLGGMAELGPEATSYHREIGAHARDAGVDLVIGVGEMARDYAPDEWAPDARAAAPVVAGALGEGDAVLVKGSRAIGLEALVEKLASLLGDAGETAARPGEGEGEGG